MNNPQAILDKAKANNISNQQIANATGYSLAQVNNYLG